MSKIIGTRGITVNVFDDDDETSITLRLLRAVMDEHEARKLEARKLEGAA